MSSRKYHAIENLCRLVLPFPWNFPYTFSAKPWSWSFAALLFYIDRRGSHLNQTGPHNNSQSWISLTKFILSGVQLAEHTRYNYPNSSIKPPPPPPRGLFFWKHLGGRGGGGLNLAKTMVSVLCNTKWKKLKYKNVGGHAAEYQKPIRTSSWWINYLGSVHTKFYSGDWLIQSIIY